MHEAQACQVLKGIHKLGLYVQQQGSKLADVGKDLLEVQVDFIDDQPDWHNLPYSLQALDHLHTKATTVGLCQLTSLAVESKTGWRL